MEEQKTLHYYISAGFAKKENVPVSFVAKPIIETQKAVYLYGHGEIDPAGHCARCGRTLTHPGSILIGIGPECLGDWGARDQLKENMTEQEKDYLKSLIRSKEVDGWFPKGVIKETEPAQEDIKIPEEHPMLNGKKKDKQKREALLVKYQNTGNPAIKIMFPFSHEDLANVKSLPGRRFHNEGAEKYWTCPLSVDSVEALDRWGFEMDPKFIEFLRKSKTSVNDVDADIEIPGLQMELFPFQKKGVNFIEARDGRALIGDEMGLGKTAQALAWLQLHPEKQPAIIVCPASLKLNWIREARMWMKEPNVQVVSGKKPYPIIGDIVIINYDILSNWVNALKDIHPKVLIADECHYFKNNGTKRTKAVKALGKNIPHVIALSGTPIVNRPIEGFNALRLIDSTVTPDFWTFARQYCGAKHNGFGWDFSGATNTEELHEKLTNTVMLRRLKKDVLQDLPDKIYSFTPMELNNEKQYRRAEKNFIQWVKESKGIAAANKASNAEALAEIEGLKQLAVKGKMKQSIEWIHNLVDTDGKLVVFATHKFVIAQLMEEFGDVAVKVDGSVSGADREKAVDAFQNDESVRLFIGNIKAAGIGLTLTAASTVVFLELPWTPGELVQAEDRCHRIGQKNSVNIYYLLASGTIEERIAAMLDQKRKVLDAVLDGKETEEGSLLSELMKAYKE